MLSEGDQLAIALALSAQDAALGRDVMNEIRKATDRAGQMVREDKHAQSTVVNLPGRIVQINTLNQYGHLFDVLKDEFQAPQSICGYLACTNLLLLEEFIKQQEGVAISMETIRDFCSNNLCEINRIESVLRQVLDLIQTNRIAYWTSHGKDTADKKDLMQWVANYEISDCLKSFATISVSTSRSVFVRYNQWPFREEATPDEAERLLEERCFGGRIEDKAKETVTYMSEDSVYFIEEFDGKGKSIFYTPEQWQVNMTAVTESNLRRALVMDIQGHFMAGLVCMIENKRHLIIFNTTETDYISSFPAVGWTYDAMFCGGHEPDTTEIIREST